MLGSASALPELTKRTSREWPNLRASFETQTARCPEETKPWAGPSGSGKSGQGRSAFGGVQISLGPSPAQAAVREPRMRVPAPNRVSVRDCPRGRQGGLDASTAPQEQAAGPEGRGLGAQGLS